MESTTAFVLAQRMRMPDYLRFPIFGATLCFACAALLTRRDFFHRLSAEKRWWHVQFMRRIGPFHDLMRFYEGLSVFAYGKALDERACTGRA